MNVLPGASGCVERSKGRRLRSLYADGLFGIAVIATMHRKEVVIAPALERGLGLDVRLAADVDTDLLGAFTGEIVRHKSARDMAVAKAHLALQRMPSAAYGVGSEGSFGPHPLLPFVNAGSEIVALVARDDTLRLFGYDLTMETNALTEVVHSLPVARAYAARLGFPSHAIVISGVEGPRPSFRYGIFKGVDSDDGLRAAVTSVLQACGAAALQSDMRAHHNPTRMRSIERAAQDLVRRAITRCPRCHHPGYEQIDRHLGLPCRVCESPTGLVRSVVFGCAYCGQREEHPRPDGRDAADPGECEYCNP